MQYTQKYTLASFPPTLQVLGRGTGISPGEGGKGIPNNHFERAQTTLPGMKTSKPAKVGGQYP